MRLDRDLGIAADAKTTLNPLQKRGDLARRKQAGRSTADVHRIERTRGTQRRQLGKLPIQRVEIVGEQLEAADPGHKGAVGALRRTEGNVNIEVLDRLTLRTHATLSKEANRP